MTSIFWLYLFKESYYFLFSSQENPVFGSLCGGE